MPSIDWRYMHNPPPADAMTWGDKAAVAAVCILVGLWALGSVLIALWWLMDTVLPAIPVLVAENIRWGGQIVGGWL